MVRGLVDQGIIFDTLVDVGANRGQFAVASLELTDVTTVVSFEPLPNHRSTLESLLLRYPGRFEFHAIGLADTSSTLSLNVNSHDQSSSLLSLAESHLRSFPGALPVSVVQVPVERLDSLIAAGSLPPNALLKIDVQGFERQVLHGAGDRLGEFSHVLVEASFKPMYEGEWTFAQLIAFMEAKGFAFLRPVGSLRDPRSGEYLQMDALFGRPL